MVDLEVLPETPTLDFEVVLVMKEAELDML